MSMTEQQAVALARAIDAANTADIVVWWHEYDSPQVIPQGRTVIERDGALWTVPPAESPTRWSTRATARSLYAKLQQRYYPAGLKTGPFNLPPSQIRIIQRDAHPLALYAAAEEVRTAAASMGNPPAITVADIAERFPSLGAPRWLHDCEDSDFVDFAMDAAGYQWTDSRIGKAGPQMSKIRYVFVQRGLAYEQSVAAIKELKARARKAAAKR